MKIFIGCGSNPKIGLEYQEEVKKVCKLLCSYDYSLVYGAYNEGLMKVCFDTFKECNKDIIGVNLEVYDEVLGIHNIVKNNSFERLDTIYEISDMFLILPGGVGSLAELFGLIEELKTNKKKKLIVYNYNNYYSDLFSYLDKCLKEGFLYDNDLDNIIVINNINDLEREIKNERY